MIDHSARRHEHAAQPRSWRRRLLALAACALTGASVAEDLTGESEFVCTAWRANSCSTENDCESTESWRLNMPDFLKVDLRAGELVTPDGSSQPRQTEIGSVSRNGGRLFLSGFQEDRGYTWVINEGTGEGTLAIVSDTTAVMLFTACVAIDRL